MPISCQGEKIILLLDYQFVTEECAQGNVRHNGSLLWAAPKNDSLSHTDPLARVSHYRADATTPQRAKRSFEQNDTNITDRAFIEPEHF